MWPTQSNPTVARSLPRIPTIYDNRVWDEEEGEIYFNGIRYNDLLHEQEAIVWPSDMIEALTAFCQEQDITVRFRKLNASLGRGGTYRGDDGRIVRGLTLDPNRYDKYRFVRTFIHEIVHAIGHTFRSGNGWGYIPRSKMPSPIKEAEAYLVESRVYSFFFPRMVEGTIEPDFVKAMNNRLYWYGPKRNVQMIREEQCVEFSDNLILWLIDWLSERGKL